MTTVNFRKGLKGNLLALGITVGVFGIAGYATHTQQARDNYDLSYITAKADTSQDNLSTTTINNSDVTDQLEVSNVHSRTSNTLNYISGKITNTGNSTLNDVFGEMAIYDTNGNLIRVKEMNFTLKAGQSYEFDELVDQYTHAASVKLQQFHE